MDDISLVEALMDEIKMLNTKIAKLESELDTERRALREARSDIILAEALKRDRP
tara:strand:+ start:329 stop:490 length:162 start_codon:yes stop_codon:yes gene_type:complete